MSGSDSIPTTPDDMGRSSDLEISASLGHDDDSPPLFPGESTAAEPCSDDKPKRMPSLRSVSDPPNMNPSSTAMGLLGRARNPSSTPPTLATGAGGAMNNDVMARARALHQARMGMSPMATSPNLPPGRNGFPLAMPSGAMHRPSPVPHPKSDPVIPKPSLSQRKFGMKLSDMGVGSSAQSPTGLRRAGAPKLADMTVGAPDGEQKPNGSGLGSKLDDFKKYIDAEKGWITFDGAATITKTGVNFASGQTFTISLDEVHILDELGKGNYGTVYKVKHAKPSAPRFGHGLSGVRLPHSLSDTALDTSEAKSTAGEASSPDGGDSATSGKLMAMKEIRLELDDAKFSTILKELVILHECVSPYIIDFYGAFFQEGAVYICIEYMDGGSIDKLYTGGIPEDVLRKITYSTVRGLKSLKDEHNIIHRDVKPTNILVNAKGQVKICDFGVSGNLVASIAKTNIGCQSYMAPERISGGGTAPAGSSDGTYSVQSDIWSLGLTIIECAMGRYPYPPEVSSTIFSQLNAIVEGDPPDLPKEGYSETAQSFVSSCLHKVPKMRATYAMLLNHPWLQSFSKPQTIAEEAEEGDEAEKAAEAVSHLQLGKPAAEDAQVAAWVKAVLRGGNDKASDTSRPALHAAPLDSVSPLNSPLPSRAL
ncbi:mitogen activated protein kinase kinase [Metarhizium rileyi]|uniref:mitogen-activated protein kinase kinase n=1 Tax=Metarhizium rileyi (strain RCEF 4871) TaxID=1649241 RepID=A0A167GSN1_METRR|nr:mitogen activated protein kinase kinase [Metarhizium rileyi RCEF 4871]